MTGRSRVLAALSHRHTDRIPIAMVCSGINEPLRTDLDQLLRRSRGVTLSEYLAPLVDIVGIGPRYAGPPLADGTDIWGVKRAPVSHGSGAYDEIAYHPLGRIESAADLSSYPWPDPGLFDYSDIREKIDAERGGADRCLMAANGNLFESSWYMRGFERMFLDMTDDPPLVEGIMDRVLEFYLGYFERILHEARGGVDLVFTADDLGGQQGLLMSREMWERFIRPRHAELNSLIHGCGAKVIYHSDGAIMDVVDGLIETGIDVLQALQFSAAGMDPVRLEERFGGGLCFEGGVCVQKTLPFGSEDDVREEVRNLIRVLGRDGGYILGPSHAVQAGTPPENVLAMFDTAAEYYPHRNPPLR